jgi:hypothetical protein
MDCNKKFMGWTGISFYVMYGELYLDIKARNSGSNFARFLIERNYLVDCIENMMNVIHSTKQGGHLNTSEKCYICNETKNDNANE